MFPIMIYLPLNSGKTLAQLKLVFSVTMSFAEARVIASLKKGPYAMVCQAQQAQLN